MDLLVILVAGYLFYRLWVGHQKRVERERLSRIKKVKKTKPTYLPNGQKCPPIKEETLKYNTPLPVVLYEDDWV